ncbi:hypothetical protein NDU88_006076 [Pleurodeles waltl]|uniref:Uncharacterized protein n=1 Tax=Pleurodeles waltl TaxID=8319 RepID=A0AAV7MB61_PLEWA|nr:hypothetical protein NDU88_006076 [Pleurodeles waltl]
MERLVKVIKHTRAAGVPAPKGAEEQEQSVRAFCRRKTEMNRSDGRAGEEKETRSATRDDQGAGDVVAMDFQPEDLHNESESPSARSGYA